MRTESADTIRTVLLDDEGLARESFSSVLSQEEGVELIGSTDSPWDALALAERSAAHIILTDVIVGHEKALEVVGGATGLGAKIVVITHQESEHHLSRALKLGARGYLLKWTTRQELTAAIRAVASGNAYICPPMASLLLDRFKILPPLSGPHETAFPELSEREVQVLKDIALGMSNHEIAQDLSLTIATVKSHVSNVLAKLGLRDRLQAGILAHRKGLTRN
ncbi:LuxR C-terminal-related transcriptional regulator [Streptomyces radicis]|uniref:DNA-binding response regulator n=1 Tax=Streptomyces radicis TaxID=1750517 RepID=A0A3A9WIR8_9ACTN|nr:response regulator transcription factor [Streptomyces radicis]RKN12875.1 DNA-binding response regulator [Streptomyces radicis]RKN27360.1 DNA-binding response regulator [Streptomyces radicis]